MSVSASPVSEHLAASLAHLDHRIDDLCKRGVPVLTGQSCDRTERSGQVRPIVN